MGSERNKTCGKGKSPFFKKFDCGLDESRGLGHHLGMQNNGEMNELKVWIAGEFGKLRSDLNGLQSDLNGLRTDMNALETKMDALETKMDAKMDAGFRQVNNRIDENQMKTNERLSRIELNLVSLMG